MPKPRKPSLKSIVASAATRRPQDTKVVHSRRDSVTSMVGARGTLKQRARQMSVYLDPAVYDQLRDIAYTERTKMHPLILEALDLLFGQRGARSVRELEEGGKTA